MEIKEAIKRAKENDQKAFNFLLDTFWDDVYGFQLKRIQNENDAEDITIQTFSKAFDRIETFDDSFKFKTWLITISKNIHMDLLRKEKKSIAQITSNDDKSVYQILDETADAHSSEYKKIRMTAFISSKVQKSRMDNEL